MLIYEKDNKLNINFENSIEEQPDLQISKSGDKTEVLIDGQPCGGGGITVYYVDDGNKLYKDENLTVPVTGQELQDAFNSSIVHIIEEDMVTYVACKYEDTMKGITVGYPKYNSDDQKVEIIAAVATD